MFDINTKVQWRTGGRGVFRIVKGTIIAIVKRGKLPVKSMQDKVPHGDKTSNRDRYIVEIKDGVFAWANIKTCWKQGDKMPPAKHRFAKPGSKAKGKAKNPSKAKTTKMKKPKAKIKVVVKDDDRMAQPVVKKSGGDKPKTTWYGIVDGKIVSVRKVICPEGFSKDKPALPEQPQNTPEVATAPAAVGASSSDLPTA